MRHRKLRCVWATLLVAGVAAVGSTSAHAQEPDGPIDQVRQPIIGGTEVDVDTQRRLGLITVANDGGTCSGTLLNQFWVLTARHCATTNGEIDGPLALPGSLSVSAAWADGRVGVASRIHEFALSTARINAGDRPHDMVLLYLGTADLGAAPSQRIHAVNADGVLSGRLTTEDTVTQYGRGRFRLAYVDDAGKPVPAERSNVYRSMTFNATSIADTGYDHVVSSGGQSVAAGDSGGPSWVTRNGNLVGIAGVASWCDVAYLPMAPATTWDWVTSIRACHFAATEPVMGEILDTIRERPGLASSDRFAIMGRSDFNGDGKDDIAAFTRGGSADVWAGLSNGHGFDNAGKWSDWFVAGGEIPALGDFDGDGRDDIAAFTRGADADVWVGLSTGSGFVNTGKWSDFFVQGDEIPAVGDFNGDGKDDIAAFTRGSAADVWVGLSESGRGRRGVETPRPGAGPRNAFFNAGKWSDWFAWSNSIPAVGDFNGDGKDDIAAFSRGRDADVFVALSTGTGFTPVARWSDWFVAGSELPAVGDFDGDGKDDIAAFTRGADADVWVGISSGHGFVNTGKWSDFFVQGDEIPGVGDFDGDGQDDIAAFSRGGQADVWVGLSDSGRARRGEETPRPGMGPQDAFVNAGKWSDWFVAGDEIPGPGVMW